MACQRFGVYRVLIELRITQAHDRIGAIIGLNAVRQNSQQFGLQLSAFVVISNQMNTIEIAADGLPEPLRFIVLNDSCRCFLSRWFCLDLTNDTAELQGLLVKIVTRLSTFRGESSFRTWAYRIALRSVLDHARSRPEQAVTGFDCYARYLAAAPDEEPQDLTVVPADTRLVVEEVKLSCMLGLLLCLDRDQRLVFVLGELFEVSDTVGSEVLELTRANFRQRLARARHQLHEFLRGRCGLVDPRNPCRCARKTRAFVRDGVVDPERLLFAHPHVERMREASARGRAALASTIEAASAALWGEHPFLEPPDLVARLRDTLEGDRLRAALQLQ
jgi:RNA polymerase sigma factor (sigma-70 family)